MPADSMLAARNELIDRIERTADAHALTNAELAAVVIHAAAAVLMERTGLPERHAGEALAVAVRRYVAGP